MLTIDHTKCSQDELCMDECPFGFIFAKDEKGFPTIRSEPFNTHCIRCWHCIAICPRGAISHPEVALEKLEVLKRKEPLSYEQANRFIRSRRTLRRFKPDPVSDTTISKWLDITRWSPTASNSQQVSWIMVPFKFGIPAADHFR